LKRTLSKENKLWHLDESLVNIHDQTSGHPRQ
jgi:hypothetical protein